MMQAHANDDIVVTILTMDQEPGQTCSTVGCLLELVETSAAGEVATAHYHDAVHPSYDWQRPLSLLSDASPSTG